MLSRFCKLCHNRVDLTVVNLRRYRILPCLREKHDDNNDDNRGDDKKRVPLIISKRPQFNFYKGTTYSKFQSIPLASQGWQNPKSKGDYFTIYPSYNENEELDEDNYDGEEADEREEESDASFDKFEVHPQLIANLKENNIFVPTKIQDIAIPSISIGQHTILSAETGCGKTFAFLLPILNHIFSWKRLEMNSERKSNSPFGMIITPSRELAAQIGMEAKKLSKNLNINVKVLIGGRTKRLIDNPTLEDVDLLIGTFGVISKMITTKIYKLHFVRHVVLDEAHALFHETFDEKLEVLLKKIPFSPGIATVDNNFPTACQLTLVSATKPSEMPDYLNNILDFSPGIATVDNNFPTACQLTLVSATKPSEMPDYLNNILDIKSLVNAATENFHRVMVPQKFFRLAAPDKPSTLLRLVKPKAMKKHSIIIFSNDSTTSDWITLFLNEFNIRAINCNGEMPMAIRKDKFASFQRGVYNVLSTTNSGARGLDTVDVNHVINYDFPMETADYIHRCGRTGRIGSKGDCKVTNFIVRSLEVALTQKIERATRRMRALPIFNMLDEHAKQKEKLSAMRSLKEQKHRKRMRRSETRVNEEKLKLTKESLGLM